MSVEELLEQVERDVVFYKHSGGGVTLSGGEPLMFPDFSTRFLRACKSAGLSTGVDTCGYAPWRIVDRILPYVDFFLWDIKHMNSTKHKEFTGVFNDLILENARLVSKRGIPLYIRIPLIPGYNDSEENLVATSKFIRNLSSVTEVHLLPLHHLGKARYESLNRPYPIVDLPLFSNDVLESMKRLVERHGLKCSIVG